MPKITIAGHTIYDERQFKAMTGITWHEFEELVPVFHSFLITEHKTRKRSRALGGGRTGKLGGFSEEGSRRKLLFVLVWLKAYPTYDVFSFIVGMHRSRCQRWTTYLLPLLEATLGRKIALPERQIKTVDEFLEKFPGVRDIFIDGTERPVQKPVNKKRKKKLYSGKKKTTTRKHIIAVSENERILILGKSKTGRRHDKRIAERQQILQTIPLSVDAWADTGFAGMQHSRPPDKTHLPHKATKNRPLTNKQKQDNHVIGSFRVVVEHAIGHAKRYRATADIWRGRTPGQDDQVMLLAAGLWNFHLDCKQTMSYTG